MARRTLGLALVMLSALIPGHATAETGTCDVPEPTCTSQQPDACAALRSAGWWQQRLCEQNALAVATRQPERDIRYWIGRSFERVMLPGARRVETEDDVKQTNDNITRAYVDMYWQRPDAFKWCLMAAFASGLVGEGMNFASSRYQYFASPLNPSTWIPHEQVFWLLAAGNISVYYDIFWQHIAYHEGGLAALETVARAGQLHESAFAAWRTIDRGVRTNDEELVWNGNRELLEFEQFHVLQPAVYDRDRPLWRRMSGLVDSPIPDDDTSFRDFVPRGDIGRYRDRWRWIRDSMLPKYQRWEAGHRNQGP